MTKAKRSKAKVKRVSSLPRPPTLAPTKKGRANSGRYRKGSSTITLEQQQTFLTVLGEGYSPTLAAKTAEAPRKTFYDLRENNDTFAAAWDAAVEAGTQHLEDVAVRRATVGVAEPIMYKGKVKLHVHKPSDLLLMQQLNARAAAKYRTNVKLEANVDVSKNFAEAMEAATDGK